MAVLMLSDAREARLRLGWASAWETRDGPRAERVAAVASFCDLFQRLQWEERAERGHPPRTLDEAQAILDRALYVLDVLAALDE